MGRLRKIYLVALCSGSILTVVLYPAAGNTILGEHNWNVADSLENWTEGEAWVSLSNPNEGGLDDTGYLRITFDEAGAGKEETVPHTPATALFAGAWKPEMWIEFNFWAEDVSPSDIEVRWQSSTNSDIWTYELTPPATQTWTRFETALSYSGSAWDIVDLGGGTEDKYLADLSSIDWIGVYIRHEGGAGSFYGLDDFRLTIPEPPEFVMLLAALVTSAMSLRKKRSAGTGDEHGAASSHQDINCNRPPDMTKADARVTG